MQTMTVAAGSRIVVTLHYRSTVTGQSVLVISMAFCAVFCDRNLKIGFFWFERVDFIMTVLTTEIFIYVMKAASVLFFDVTVARPAGNQARFFFQNYMFIQTFKTRMTASAADIAVYRFFVLCCEFAAFVAVCTVYLQTGSICIARKKQK
jgi:hypothetical protein